MNDTDKSFRKIFSTPKGPVIIRQANLSDANQFSTIRMEALRDNPSIFGSSVEARENCTVEWANKILQANPVDSTLFILENNNNIIGLSSIRRFSGVKICHSAGISGVFIKPDWRGIGLLDELFFACTQWAIANQVIIVKLAVTTTNTRAIKAYQRLGFQIYGTEPKVIFHDGIYYDEYLLSREVDFSKTVLAPTKT